MENNLEAALDSLIVLTYRDNCGKKWLHFHFPRRLCPFLSKEDLESVIHAFIISMLLTRAKGSTEVSSCATLSRPPLKQENLPRDHNGNLHTLMDFCIHYPDTNQLPGPYI